jgi:acyl carrier protein
MTEPVPAELLERVRKVVAEEQKLPLEKVTPEATFEELGIDSLDGIHLLFALENEFNINITDDAVKKVKTIAELAAGVEMLMNAKPETGDEPTVPA